MYKIMDFPGGLGSKVSDCNAGDLGSLPRSGKNNTLKFFLWEYNSFSTKTRFLHPYTYSDCDF